MFWSKKKQLDLPVPPPFEDSNMELPEIKPSLSFPPMPEFPDFPEVEEEQRIPEQLPKNLPAPIEVPEPVVEEPKTIYVPAKPVFEMPRTVEKKALPSAMFISSDDYRVIMQKANELRHIIGESEHKIKAIADLKSVEESEFDKWRNNIDEIEKRLQRVDELLAKAEVNV